LHQNLRTFTSEEPPLSEKCPNWSVDTSPRDCGSLLWTDLTKIIGD